MQGAAEDIKAGKRKRIKELEVMVAEVRRETHDTRTLVLFTGNDLLDYRPGHFLTIDPRQFSALARWIDYFEDIKGKREPPRAYSLASSPHERHLAITVKEEPYLKDVTKYPPLLSPLLTWRTGPGARMTVTGFTGPYTLPDDIDSKTDHLVHVCAGSGVVPNWSIVKHALHNGLKLRHTFIFGNRTWADVIYRNELEVLAKQYPDQLKLIFALSRESTGDQSDGLYLGRVGADLLRRCIPDPDTAIVYACGPANSRWEKKAAKERGEDPEPRFMETVAVALRDMGISKDRLKTESYG